MARNRVAFQGARGAFSEDAARQLLGDAITFKPCERFEDVFQSLASGDVNAAVVPIENTLHGSIHENYDHLLDFKLPIVGETRVRIVHNLIGRPEATLSEVKTAISHPVALRQCLTFFKKNKRIHSEIYYDTAGSVRRIMEEDDPTVAAIASATAAKYYGARLLKKSIEDDRQNYTRFFLLKQKAPKRPAKKVIPLKTSIVFTTPNKPSTLFRCMSAFALRDINLDKIESRPFRGRPFEYLFYLDFLGSPDDPNCRNAMSHLREITDFVAVLGCYPQAA